MTDELQAGIDMRKALIAYAKANSGEMTPSEAEFYMAGYIAGGVMANARGAVLAASDSIARRQLLVAFNDITRMLMEEPASDPDDDGDFVAGKAAGIVQYHAELIKYVHLASACTTPTTTRGGSTS